MCFPYIVGLSFGSQRPSHHRSTMCIPYSLLPPPVGSRLIVSVPIFGRPLPHLCVHSVYIALFPSVAYCQIVDVSNIWIGSVHLCALLTVLVHAIFFVDSADTACLTHTIKIDHDAVSRFSILCFVDCTCINSQLQKFVFSLAPLSPTPRPFEYFVPRFTPV